MSAARAGRAGAGRAGAGRRGGIGRTGAGRHWWRQWLDVAWLAVVWMLLWGDVSWANLIGGLAVGVLITLAFAMAPIEFSGRVRPGRVLVLAARFLVDLVRASAQVAFLALRPGPAPRGAVVGVQLVSHSDLYLTLTAELVSLVPGSLVVEVNRLTGRLYLHVLDLARSGGPPGVRAEVLAQERRVLWALASRAELIEAGVVAP
ncbi:MAG: Na+/H+ antiporter subunit E [Micrococcales bacterium]|nr:Na+/H+ antiporter subunit E [Micrococcales bacterium]